MCAHRHDLRGSDVCTHRRCSKQAKDRMVQAQLMLDQRPPVRYCGSCRCSHSLTCSLYSRPSWWKRRAPAIAVLLGLGSGWVPAITVLCWFTRHVMSRSHRRRVHGLGAEEIRCCRFKPFHLVEGLTVCLVHRCGQPQSWARATCVALYLQVIGRGSFGKVYLAQKKTMPKKVLCVHSCLLHTYPCISSLRHRASTSPSRCWASELSWKWIRC